MPDLQFVAVEHTGSVATLTVQRPDKLNALNARVVGDISRALLDLIHPPSGGEPVRAVIVTGAGKAFIAGADIAEMAAMTPVEAKRFSELGQRMCALVEVAPFPVIAAVNGFALGGGCELT